MTRNILSKYGKTNLSQYGKVGLSALLGIAVFLFWWLGYPQALSYQEQYQLFLWTGDYLMKALSVAGGLADWLGEFVVQFYYVEWLGALLLSVLFVLLQRLVARCAASSYLLSFVPPILLLWLMGDACTLLSYTVALVLALAAYLLMRRIRWYADLIAVPLLYWAAGPMAWLYVVLRVLQGSWRQLWMPVWLLAAQLFVWHALLTQYPLMTVLTGITYYRIPMQFPALMWVIPVVIAAIMAYSWYVVRGTKYEQKNHSRTTYLLPRTTTVIQSLILAVLAWLAVGKGYDRDMYELIRQDYLVRNERWDEVIRRAEKYQVPTAFSSVCVNLALSQKHQLADRMFRFYQSGEDALVMPRIRDLTSMLPSAEVFWRLGMVNSAQRYMFDTQESILNGKKSGRCTKRIAECMLVNGHNQPARKHLDLLKKSLFYRSWAQEAEQLIGNEVRLSAHPVYGKLRRLRFRDNFLYSHEELDKMLGLLFMNNNENRMALDYFMGQMLLKGELRGFQQYMPWVQQYGGYSQMPAGYQDAMLCIQRQGNVAGSPYAAYAKRMMGMK